MKKILLFVLSLALVLTLALGADLAHADSRRFVEFPTMGYCTGNSVNLRVSPVNGKPMGKGNDDSEFVVVGARNVKGDMWYEIENPNGSGNLWISGRYLQPLWVESSQTDPFCRLMVSIYQDYGMTPARARALLGRPIEENGENLRWNGLDLEFYFGKRLGSVNITGGSWQLGGIKIGDDFSKVERLLGSTQDHDEMSMTYRISDMEFITFNRDENNGPITSMNYVFYIDVE